MLTLQERGGRGLCSFLFVSFHHAPAAGLRGAGRSAAPGSLRVEECGEHPGGIRRGRRWRLPVQCRQHAGGRRCRIDDLLYLPGIYTRHRGRSDVQSDRGRGSAGAGRGAAEGLRDCSRRRREELADLRDIFLGRGDRGDAGWRRAHADQGRGWRGPGWWRFVVVIRLVADQESARRRREGWWGGRWRRWRRGKGRLCFSCHNLWRRG